MKSFFSQTYLQLILLTFLSLSLRLIFLNNVQTGISHDEIDFIINAKAVLYRFSDITGQWFPFSLTTIPHEQAKSEFLYVLLAPFIGPFHFSLFLAKLPFALANTGLVIVLYLLIKKLLGQKNALFVGIVCAFNPWMLFVARTAYEAPVAVFFYILSFYLLIILRNWKILYVMIPLFLGFTSYMGTKLIFIPFWLLIAGYTWLYIYKKKYTTQLLLLSIFVFALSSYFFFSILHQATGYRISEINSPYNPAVISQVNLERRQSLMSLFTNLFVNKWTILIEQSIERYFQAFSNNLLFLYSDPVGILSFFQHGFFYAIDAVFIFIGFINLYIKQKRVFFLFILLLLLAPLPAVVDNLNLTFVLRSALLFPFLMIFSGLGFSALWEYCNKTKNILLLCAVIIICAVSLSNFLYLLFFRYPVYNSEAFLFSSRELARYIVLAKQNNEAITILTPEDRSLFKEYIFYSNSYQISSQKEMEKIFKTNIYSYNNVSFSSCKSMPKLTKDQLIIAAATKSCESVTKNLKHPSVIAQLSDSGAVYNIYNDQLCAHYNLAKYISSVAISDLNVEKISAYEFCTKFIIKYN